MLTVLKDSVFSQFVNKVPNDFQVTMTCVIYLWFV